MKKIIIVESCKKCPYRKISHSFISLKDGWYLRCGKKYEDGFKEISHSPFDKKGLDFKIPEWCPLPGTHET